MILMIGGMIYDWISDSKKRIGIWKFCFKTNKWNKLFDFNYYNISATLSSNENYVIIAGGYDKFAKIEDNNKIFVLI